jgi:hypothetical protein
MPDSGFPSAAPRRRRWLPVVAFVLVVVLAAAWTGVWFYAARRAEADLAAWRQRERQAGLTQTCASQSIGGYPFLLEVHCGGAGLELQGMPTLQFKLPLAVAAVQVYDPKLLIGEFTGPLEVSEARREAAAVINWSLGQASVRGLPSGVERVSLVLVGPTVRAPSLAGNDPVLSARRMELHARQAPGSRSDSPTVEAALRFDAAVAEKLASVFDAAVADKLGVLAAKPIDADIAGTVRGLEDLSPKPWPAWFKGWQTRGGELKIEKARLAQQDVIAMGTGALKLTARGGLDGTLRVVVVGIEKILKMLDIDRMMTEGQVGASFNALDRLVPGLGGMARQSAAPSLIAALGERTELEGKPAVAFPIRFDDGTVFLGPFRVGAVPPLF